MGGRNLGTIPLASVQSDQFDHSYFVRVDVGGAVGTKRFTDRFGGFTGNIDGGSQTWTETDLIVGQLDQGTQSTFTVSSLNFANLDWTWTGWANTPGLRGATVQVWDGWFNTATGALLGSVKLYGGKIDSGDFGARAQLALMPHIAPWSRAVPSATAKQLGAAKLMPATETKIYWGGWVTYTSNTAQPISGPGGPKPWDLFGDIFGATHGRQPGRGRHHDGGGTVHIPEQPITSEE